MQESPAGKFRDATSHGLLINIGQTVSRFHLIAWF